MEPEPVSEEEEEEEEDDGYSSPSVLETGDADVEGRDIASVSGSDLDGEDEDGDDEGSV